MRILLNSHRKFSKDLVAFTFCSVLSPRYEETACQYLDNITDIKTYKPLDIIAQTLQEENCQRVNSTASGSALNKFSTMKNLDQKCAKCGKTNHSTQIIGQGESIHKRARGNSPKIVQVPQGTKKKDEIKKQGERKG